MESRKVYERNFVDLTSVSPHLFCSVCVEVFRKPTKTNCGHTFCSRCITKWACQRGTCPECREIIKLRKLQPDLIVSKIIDDMQVYCSSKDKCSWKGKLENLFSHLKICQYQAPRETPEWVRSCNNVIEIKDSEENVFGKVLPKSDSKHSKICIKRSYRMFQTLPYQVTRFLYMNPMTIRSDSRMPLVIEPSWMGRSSSPLQPSPFQNNTNNRANTTFDQPFLQNLPLDEPSSSGGNSVQIGSYTNHLLLEKRERPCRGHKSKIEHFLHKNKRRINH